MITQKAPEDKLAWDAAFDRESKLIYALIVAGKSANFADKAVRVFLHTVACLYGAFEAGQITVLPFTALRALSSKDIDSALRKAKTGNYIKLNKAIADIKAMSTLDLRTVTPAQLEQIHGCGAKTSRFFIMWIRPLEEYAALDVHVLRWLANKGYNVPRQTPQSPTVYARIEKIFLEEARKLKKTPRQLDMEIWEAGAGRTQEKAI